MDKKTKIILIDSKLYSLEAVYGAAYSFLDKIYIYLERGPKSKIKVILRGRAGFSEKKLENLKGEFLNELINFSLREQISKRNQKIREYVVTRALVSALGEMPRQIPFSEKRLSKTKNNKKIWQKDPLGIAVPWEEKKSTKKPRRKKKRK